MSIDLHNLNVRLIENKNILWTCSTERHYDALYEELRSQRIRSGIANGCALVMSDSVWLKMIRRAKAEVDLCTTETYMARGVMGVWHAANGADEVVLIADGNMTKEDRFISLMSYAFVHISQVKYPRQHDAPPRGVRGKGKSV